MDTDKQLGLEALSMSVVAVADTTDKTRARAKLAASRQAG